MSPFYKSITLKNGIVGNLHFKPIISYNSIMMFTARKEINNKEKNEIQKR